MTQADKDGTATGAAHGHGGSPATEELVIPIAEETVRITKRETVNGRVRVRTVTDMDEQLARAVLEGERIEIRRVPLDQIMEPGAAAPLPRTEGNVTILPIFEEVLVVEKRLVLKEELHIIRHATSEVAEFPVSVRRQRAVVERLDDEGVGPEPTENSTNTEQVP